MPRSQFGAVQARHLLAGIINEADGFAPAFVAELDHGDRVIGRDDNEIGFATEHIGDGIIAGEVHCAAVKEGQLIIVVIGIGEKRRGKDLVDLDHRVTVDAVAFQPAPIIAEVAPDSTHQFGAQAELGHGESDIGCDAAPMFGHIVDQKTEA